MADGRVAFAADAFINGFPLVFDVQEVDRFAREGIGAVPATPFNQFGHASALAGPETKFVSVNNDTVYSIANVDTTGGPVRLDVPDTAGRYYVLQFVDAWDEQLRRRRASRDRNRRAIVSARAARLGRCGVR